MMKKMKSFLYSALDRQFLITFHSRILNFRVKVQNGPALWHVKKGYTEVTLEKAFYQSLLCPSSST